MRICFVSIDVEKDREKDGFEGVENLDAVLKSLKENKIAATLFVSGEVLEKYQVKFKDLSQNFEIASHSFTHRFWDTIPSQERENELDKFINLYWGIFGFLPKGFRAPSHIIDSQALGLLEKKGFLYDSSVLPHYPFFKKYPGYKGKALLFPYHPSFAHYRKEGEMKIVEIPVAGQLFGIPLAGIWLRKLPFFIYKAIFFLYSPLFLVLNLHSFDVLESGFLEKLGKILNLLKEKNYQFLKGEEIAKNYEFLGDKR